MKISLARVSAIFLAAMFASTSAALSVHTEAGIAYANRPNCILDIRYPTDETNFPTVVWFHGGGLSGGRRNFIEFANRGIAQIAVEYRLLGKDAASVTDCLEDAAAAVAWALAHVADYGGDPSKVFVSGHSAGAYLTMMVGMDPRWLAALGARNTDIAGLVPVSGQVTKHYNDRRYSGDKDPQFLPKIDDFAPLAHVSKNIPPILCICGQPPYEWKARAEENRFLIASCKALGHASAAYVELPLCDHKRVASAARPYIEMFILGKLPTSSP